MKSLKLSIIIPCYNCENTLHEAVDSCYLQELQDDEFEIIMVDDGSKDATREIMKQLAREYTNIRLIFHETNKGGGAARNTGIKEAHGEIIYCLDSDNIFATNSVRPILDYLKEKRVDGVAFYERRFFFGTNTKRFTCHLNTIQDRIITLLDIFNDSNTLLDNFFYTKESYLKTAGYPEHHGFDTQCFEMRYLSAGNTVRVCPNSIFYHRQAMQEKSYFERVHASGMFSVNFMLIFEDIFHLFTPEVQWELVRFPLFTNNKSYGENVLDTLKHKVQHGINIFIPDYTSFLSPTSRADWIKQVGNTTKSSQLTMVFSCLAEEKYREAQESLTVYIEGSKALTPYLEFLNLRILQGIAGTAYREAVKKTLADSENLVVRPIQTRGGIIATQLRRHQYLYQTVQYFSRFLR